MGNKPKIENARGQCKIETETENALWWKYVEE